MASSLPKELIVRNVGLLARLGEEMRIPLVVTTTRETLEFTGTSLESIQRGAPKAYATRVRRAGTLNAFDDPAFVDAIQASGRRKLIMCGLLTDVCLFQCVVSALDAGFQVCVIVDASGTSSALGDIVLYDRMRALGATATTALGILFELYPDMSKPEARRAESIAADHNKTAD
jgi:isochorismate hydrolase